MKYPPITIRCECGESKAVAYGESWTCSGCGRRWNTASIPAEEYEAVHSRIRRLKREALTGLVVAALILGYLAIIGSPALRVVAPAAFIVWYMWYWPWHRKRVHRAARSLPKWELRPE